MLFFFIICYSMNTFYTIFCFLLNNSFKITPSREFALCHLMLCVTPFLNKKFLRKPFCSLRLAFQRPIYDVSKFFLILALYVASEMTGHDLLVELLSSLLSNYCIAFGFTNLTWTTRTIPFIDNTRLSPTHDLPFWNLLTTFLKKRND